MKTIDIWFVEEVLPLEGQLESYLRRHWRNGDDIADIRQDVYVRIYKAAQQEIPENPLALMITTARNLIIDRIRREKVVSFESVMDFDRLNVSSNEADLPRQVDSRRQLELLIQHMNTLPARTQEIFFLRKIKGVSQKETARLLNVSQPTVERHVAKSVRYLAKALGANGDGQARPISAINILRKEKKQ